MKRLLLMLVLACQASYAQPPTDIDDHYRTTAVGIIYRPLKIDGLNQLLRDNHYPTPNADWFLVSYSKHVESIRADGWSTWLYLAYSDKRRGAQDTMATQCSIWQMGLGLGLKVFDKKNWAVIVQAGGEFVGLTADCYNRIVDTTNLVGYFSNQPSDKKTIALGQVCFRTGVMIRHINKSGTAWQLKTGYLIPGMKVDAGHFRGSFGDFPSNRLGGFYLAAELAIIKRRCLDD